jgi:hypothetical protein
MLTLVDAHASVVRSRCALGLGVCGCSVWCVVHGRVCAHGHVCVSVPIRPPSYLYFVHISITTPIVSVLKNYYI